MQNQNEVYGIIETMDVIEALANVTEAYLEAKEDDGKVSRTEAFGIAVGTFPSMVKAGQGIAKVPAELGDLSDNELAILREEGYGPLLENQPHLSDAIFYASKLSQSIRYLVLSRKGAKLPSVRELEKEKAATKTEVA